MKKLIITTVCLIFSFVACQSRAEMYPVTASDKAFFESVQSAVLTNGIEQFAEIVSYPIVLKLGKVEYKLQNKKGLIERAAMIFTPRLKSIVQNQSQDSLFKNWQGVRVGNGEIWFSEVAETTTNGKIWIHLSLIHI